MPADTKPDRSPLENRLLNLAQILDNAVAAVNQAIAEVRSDESQPGQKHPDEPPRSTDEDGL